MRHAPTVSLLLRSQTKVWTKQGYSQTFRKAAFRLPVQIHFWWNQASSRLILGSLDGRKTTWNIVSADQTQATYRSGLKFDSIRFYRCVSVWKPPSLISDFKAPFVSKNSIVKSRVTEVHQQKSSWAESTTVALKQIVCFASWQRDDSPSALLLSFLSLGSCVRVCRDWRLRDYHSVQCG